MDNYLPKDSINMIDEYNVKNHENFQEVVKDLTNNKQIIRWSYINNRYRHTYWHNCNVLKEYRKTHLLK